MQSKDDLPNSLDVLITIRPHTALKLSQYKELILKGIGHE